jgi:hypothetical protein
MTEPGQQQPMSRRHQLGNVVVPGPHLVVSIQAEPETTFEEGPNLGAVPVDHGAHVDEL